MDKKQQTVITALSVAAFVLALMVSARLWFRLDLTKSRAYTISPASRSIFRTIPDHVRVTYYLSDKLKTIHPMPGEIEDMLREYAAFSRGKIQVSVKDPVKAGVASVIEELGVQPRQIQTVEQDMASLTTVYTGIVIEYLDMLEVLPWVVSTSTLEYDISSRILAMVSGSERRIGVIVGDTWRQWGQDFGYLEQWFTESGYRVTLVYPGDEIPVSIPAVCVFGGVEDLTAWDLYRIDYYIQQGGKVLFAVNGVYVDTVTGRLDARLQNDMGLLQMLASYGAVVKPELVLDRNALPLQYQIVTQSGIPQYRITRYPMWMRIPGEYGNPSHPITANFYGVDMYWASPLELLPPERVEAVPLFTSSPQGWVMSENYYTSPEVTYLFELEEEQTRGVKILAACLSGTFPAFFRGVAKPEREYSEIELPDLPASPSPSRIIVIGNTDFATSMINASGADYNLDFIINAADWLTSGDDVIGIRNRQPQSGRLDRISDPQKKAAAVRFAQIANVVLVPLFVIAAGLFLSWKRRRKISQSKEISGGI